MFLVHFQDSSFQVRLPDPPDPVGRDQQARLEDDDLAVRRRVRDGGREARDIAQDAWRDTDDPHHGQAVDEAPLGR